MPANQVSHLRGPLLLGSSGGGGPGGSAALPSAAPLAGVGRYSVSRLVAAAVAPLAQAQASAFSGWSSRTQSSPGANWPPSPAEPVAGEGSSLSPVPLSPFIAACPEWRASAPLISAPLCLLERAPKKKKHEQKLQHVMRELNMQQQQQQTPVMRPIQPPESPAPPALDPSFTSWNFILNDGRKQLIGAGVFGKMYKVFTDRYQTVAVKIVELLGINDARKLKKAIELEKMRIEILKDIRHPNIMLFLKSERTADGEFCIFTELISGHSLSDLMNRQQKPFDESGVRKFSLQICTALNFLHSHKPVILHRDIKCSNIMLTHEGVIKLIDFGLAKEIFTSVGMNTNLCGTWHFMAPELFSEDGRVQVTTKTDVWAFGCSVFEMMKMQPPNGDLAQHQIPMRIRKSDMPQMPPDVSASLSDFYRRCVVRDTGERADTTELLQHRFLNDDGNSVPGTPKRSNVCVLS